MATIARFEEIEAWQRSRQLTRSIYALTSRGAFARDFALRDQIRRASVSIMSNIAEGFERGGTAEFIQFLSHAKGSCGEVRAQLYVALDQAYVDARTFEEVASVAEEVSRMISGFMRYLRATDRRGAKFRRTSKP